MSSLVRLQHPGVLHTFQTAQALSDKKYKSINEIYRENIVDENSFLLIKTQREPKTPKSLLKKIK